MVQKEVLDLFIQLQAVLEGPDFWISAAAPGIAARGSNIDIFRSKSYGSEAEQERWNHMTCDNSSTWVGWRLHN